MITSPQDTSSYQTGSHSASVGASVALGMGAVSVSGNLSNGKQKGDFASVVERAGTYAGGQGFAIKVGGDTALTARYRQHRGPIEEQPDHRYAPRRRP